MRQLIFVVTFSSLAGCGAGDLALKLVPAGFDDPFNNVNRLVVTLLDDSFKAVTTFSANSSAGSVDLGDVDSGSNRLSIAGFDANDQLLARGATRALKLSSDTQGEELVPFSSLRVATALPIDRAISGTPAVDGLLDEWRASPSIVLDAQSMVSGPAGGSSDVRAEIFFAWSPTELRFAIAVIDDCTTLFAGQASSDCQPSALPDRVTIGFDGTDDGGSYGAGDVFLELSAKGAVTLAGSIKREELQAAFGLLAGRKGWVVEGAIALSALARNAIGPADRIGIDVTIIDEDPDQPEPTILRFSQTVGGARAVTPVDSLLTLGFGQPSP